MTDVAPWPDLDADVREVRRIFEKQDLTQAEVAAAIGASQSQVSRILNGQLCRSTKTFRRLRAHLRERAAQRAP